MKREGVKDAGERRADSQEGVNGEKDEGGVKGVCKTERWKMKS